MSYSKITKKKNCARCGKEFDAKKKGTYGGYTMFCSRRCVGVMVFGKGKDGKW